MMSTEAMMYNSRYNYSESRLPLSLFISREVFEKIILSLGNEQKILNEFFKNSHLYRYSILGSYLGD